MTDKTDTVAPSKRYLSIDALCEYLGCSVWTIYRLINKREIPFFTIGKRLYKFDQDVIDAWVKTRTMKTVEEI